VTNILAEEFYPSEGFGGAVGLSSMSLT